MDQTGIDEKVGYVYGYDLYSESVRQYSAITDPRTVKHAITNNIIDYLTHVGMFEVNTKLDERRIVESVLVAGTLVIACILGVGKASLNSYYWVAPPLVFMCLALATSAYIYQMLHSSADIVFIGTVSTQPANELSEKKFLRVLGGRRLCFRLSEVPRSSKVLMEVQLLGPIKLFGLPAVYLSVSKEFPYGRYFSKDGFFFPPALVCDIDNLLKSLMSMMKKKKH